METSAQPQFDLKTLLVTGGCLLGASYGSYLLYEDLNLSGARGQGSPLARIERKESKVRRKLPSSYVWRQVTQEEELFRKDSLQTGPASAATVKFNDGSVLEVGEESLVVIDDIKELSLNFVRGSAIVRNATGDARITAGKDGKAKLEELPVQLLSPANLSTVFVAEAAQKSVTFSWRARTERVNRATVQISRDRAFRGQGVQSLPAKEGVSELSVALKPGRYFWRVATEGAGAPVVRELRISPVTALKPIWPAQARKLVSWGGEVPVSFRWAGGDSQASVAGEHRLELSREPDFKTLVADEAIRPETSVANLRRIPEGTYHWRIRSRYGELELLSAAERFALEKGARIPVELAFPADKGTYELLPKARFSWSTEASDAEYRIEVQDAATQKAVAGFKGRVGSFVWDKPMPGNYRWRVTALMQDQPAGESGWRDFTLYQGKPLALKSPALNQELRYWEHPEPFTFEWSKDSLGEQERNFYQLELSADPGFRSGVISKTLKDTRIGSTELKLAEGSYHWRVRVVDVTGAPLKTSEPGRFAFGRHPPLKAPVRAEVPGSVAEVYNFYELKKNPVIAWATVPEAVGYEVIVYDPAPARATASGARGATRIFLQKTTQETSLELKGLKEGNYAWTVRPIDRLQRKGESLAPRRLRLTYGTVLEAPEALTQEVQ